MIKDLIEKLHSSIEAIEDLVNNDDFNESFEQHQENEKLRPGGYSFNTPKYIDDIFEDYLRTLDAVLDYRETDENYLQTIADLGPLSYLYEK